MLDLESAKEVATRHLRSIEEEVGEKLSLQIDSTREESFGWLFFYNTSAFLEKGNSIDMLAGNAPFLVSKNNGSVVTLGTARPIDDYLRELDGSVL